MSEAPGAAAYPALSRHAQGASRPPQALREAGSKSLDAGEHGAIICTATATLHHWRRKAPSHAVRPGSLLAATPKLPRIIEVRSSIAIDPPMVYPTSYLDTIKQP